MENEKIFNIYKEISSLLQEKGNLHGEIASEYPNWYWKSLLLLKIDRLKHSLLSENDINSIETSVDLLGYLFLFFTKNFEKFSEYVEEEIKRTSEKGEKKYENNLP